MRFKLLLLLVLYSGLVNADWSGVAFDISNSESDWKIENNLRQVHSTGLSFRIEETTEPGLRIGGAIGQVNLRVDGDPSVADYDFDTQFLSINLWQPFQLNEVWGIFAGMNYKFQSGSDNDETNEADISWSEIEFYFGTSLKLSHIRISPMLIFQSVDGDISDDFGSHDFELDDPVSTAIRFDYFVEKTAFVRLEFMTGNSEGVLLSFAREY